MKSHQNDMNTSNNSDISGFKNWSSPIPYLFGGLALMLALITAALVILACSYTRAYNSSSSTSAATNNSTHHDQQKSPKQVEMDQLNSSEPKIVVIMAGDHNPTFLAMPISTTRDALQV